MVADYNHPAIPMDKVIANELEILGKPRHAGAQVPALLAMIRTGKLPPEKLIRKTITLEESVDDLVAMHDFKGIGITVIDRF